MPSPPCQGLPKHPRRWLQRWLGDTHQSANHNAGELWSHRWQKMWENQQCFGPKRLLWPVQHYLYSMFDLKQRIYKKTRDWQESTWVPIFFMWANLPSQISRVLLRVGPRIENLVTATVFLTWNLQMQAPPWWVLLLLLVNRVKTANPSMVGTTNDIDSQTWYLSFFPTNVLLGLIFLHMKVRKLWQKLHKSYIYGDIFYITHMP